MADCSFYLNRTTTLSASRPRATTLVSPTLGRQTAIGVSKIEVFWFSTNAWKLQPKTWQGSQLWSIKAVNTNTPGLRRYVGCTGICWELEAFWQVCVGYYSLSIKQSIKSIVCFCEWWHLLRTIHWLWLGSIKIYVSVSGRITIVVIALVAVFNLIYTYTTYFNLILI